VSYSIGIWAHAASPHGAVYRWEADGGAGGAGYVLLNLEARTVRPCDAAGEPMGNLTLDIGGGNMTGDPGSVDRAKFVRTAGAILKAYRRAGEAPRTAHAYFA
jgi:hypothetical protein